MNLSAPLDSSFQEATELPFADHSANAMGPFHRNVAAPFSQALLPPISPSRAGSPDAIAPLSPIDKSFDSLARAKRNQESQTGTSDDDTDTVRGNTKYKALAGDDQITIRKSNNTVIGGKGNDTINAQRGRGNNVLKGNGGDDELIGGGRDDMLVGGGGADLLVIADGKFNKGISIIKGFKQGDAIVIRDVQKADDFTDLTFKKQGKDTLIRVGKRDIALVQKVKPKDLKKRADDFVFTDTSFQLTEPTIGIGDITLTEGDTNGILSITATLIGDISAPVTVDYSTADGTAIANSDYTPVSGTLIFTSGGSSQTFTIPILGDTVDEATETFVVNLANAVGGAIADSQAIVTIIDNDGANSTDPALFISNLSIVEGEASRTAIATVTLDTASPSPVTVTYSTANGTAIAGSDYTERNGTLTFAPNTTTQTITIPILDDGIDELNETFVINLSNPAGAGLGNGQAQVTIIDDDTVNLSISDTSIIEGDTNSAVTFTVTLDAPSPNPVTVQYTTANGTAIAGDDYTSSSGTLTFAANTTSQTITVPIIGDTKEEEDETFVVNLSNPSNAGIIDGQATATILNDDVDPIFRDKRQGKRLVKPANAVGFAFSIFDTLPDSGQVIVDEEPDNINVGFFPNALEALYFFDDSGGNLRLQFDSGNIFEEGRNLSGKGDLTVTRSGDEIIYLFSSKTLFVFYDDDNFNLVEEAPIEADALRLILDLDLTPEEIANLPSDYPRIPSDFDPDRAVNDLDYIIENSTLIYATKGLAYGDSRTVEFQPYLCPPDDSSVNCRDLEEDIT